MTELDRTMLLIKSLDNSAAIEFSEWTAQWYVSARIEVGGDGVLSGIVEHCDTPGRAVFAFFDRLTSLDHDHYLVTGSTRDNRRHWRWNGAAFTEVARRE